MKIDKFKEFISNRFPNLTILFDLDDIKCRDMISFKCSKHGNKVSRYDHLIKYGCKDCNRDNYSKNQFDTFVNKSNDVHDNKYDYSKSNYINNKTPITIVCTKHGPFIQRPDNHLSGAGCTFCNYKITNSDFIEKSKKIHGDKYLYDKTNYINYKSYVTVGCKKHGYYSQLARVHLSGFGCPKCTESRGESAIYNYLSDKKIEFKRQYKFDNCFYKYKLPFDFYLPSYNFCIEYNGYQHYHPVKFFGGEESFKEQILKDQIKKDFCSKNKIKFIIIKYDDNIIDILDSIFKKK